MSLYLAIAPATEPVTLDEAKLQCRVTGTDEDSLLTILITAARQACETATGRALAVQTWELRLDAFPDDGIKLAKPPVSTVDSITYFDTDGVERTLDSSTYSLDPYLMPGWIVPAADTEWPDTADVANAVTVTFTCGYAEAPMILKQWMLLEIGSMYANRESIVIGDRPRRFADHLLDAYTVHGAV